MTDSNSTLDDEVDDLPCCGGYREHRYSCRLREWPATATPEVRRVAVRSDSIGPAHAKIEDLVHGDLDCRQRKQLTEILAGIWDHGRGYGGRGVVTLAVAATYRHLAIWMDAANADEALRVAGMVERYDVTDICCPCCQEIECDDGCPLEPIRTEAAS